MLYFAVVLSCGRLGSSVRVPARHPKSRSYGNLTWESDSVSLSMAACSRLLTVPTGIDKTSAASRYFKPWKYTSITTCLHKSGRASTARRSASCCSAASASMRGPVRRPAEQLGQCPRLLFSVIPRGPIETPHAMPTVAPLIVDRLIRGNRVQPRAHLSARLELAAFQVDLQERLLKHVLGHLRVAQVMPQVAVQLLLVSVDQLLENPIVRLRAIAQ